MSVDWRRPYEGKGDAGDGFEFIRQDGRIYAWSESNFCYELAWWLVLPDVSKTVQLVERIRAERPVPEGPWVQCANRREH